MRPGSASWMTGVIGFLVVIWSVFLLDWVFPGDWTQYGIAPRRLGGLIGVATAPLLHASLGHLVANTPPLLVLLVLLVALHRQPWVRVFELVLISGLLLWVVGRPAIHIGASSLIFGLISYLMLAGIWQRRLVSLGASLVIGFVYGSTLLFGILPTAPAGVSWEGHLCGALAGMIVALQESRPEQRRLGEAG